MNIEAWDKLGALEDQAKSVAVGPSTTPRGKYVSSRRRLEVTVVRKKEPLPAQGDLEEYTRLLLQAFASKQDAEALNKVRKGPLKLALSNTDGKLKIKDANLFSTPRVLKDWAVIHVKGLGVVMYQLKNTEAPNAKEDDKEQLISQLFKRKV